MSLHRIPSAKLKTNALVSIISIGTVLPGSLLAQVVRDLPVEAAVRDMSNWVQFPPRPSNSIPQPAAPAARPQPAAPIQAPGTGVDSRGWLTFKAPQPVTGPPSVPPAPVAEPARDEQPSANVALPGPVSSTDNAATTPAPRPSATAPSPSAMQPPALTGASPPISVAQPPPAATSTKPTSPAVPDIPRIKRFEFLGNSVYSADVLRKQIAAWVGQPINIPALERAAEAISGLYRQEGWLAKVELPSQDLTDGTVQILVVEAVLSGIDVQASPQAAVPASIPRNFIEHATPVNEPLSLKKLERATQLINELPGVDSSLALRPGENPGQTEAVLTLGDRKPHEGSVMVDNGGSRSTGNLRATGQATLKSLWERGDLTSLQWSKSQGLSSMRMSYSEPWGSSGLRGGFFASAGKYELEMQSNTTEKSTAYGPTNSLGLELLYPWLRNATSSINWTASLERKRFTNHFAEQLLSDYRSHTFSTGFNGQFQDPWKGSNSASLMFHLGYLDLTGSPNEASDSITARAAGMFNKTRLQWVRQQKLSDVDALQLGWQSQWASKNLDGSEKIFLGGAQGVRAYPVNEAGASAGHIANLEWFRQVQWDDGLPLTFSAFKDVGYATVNKYTWGPNESLNKYALRGHGLSVSTAINSMWGQSQLKVTWAKRLGLNPMANSTSGTDQDGTLNINRFWFTLSHYF